MVIVIWSGCKMFLLWQNVLIYCHLQQTEREMKIIFA